MAEMNVPSGPKYRLKKINDNWFLENSHTRKTKRVPFLSKKVCIRLKDNIIFADGNQYAIRVTEDGKDKIEKVTDLDYIAPDETNVNRVSEGDNDEIEKVTDLEHMYTTPDETNVNREAADDYDYITSDEVNENRVAGDDYERIKEVTDFEHVYTTPDEVNVNREAGECSRFGTDKVPDLEGLALDEVDDKVTSTQGGSTRSQQPDNGRQTCSKDGPHVKTDARDYVPFRVVLEKTPLAKLCGLSGNMELRVEKTAISFYETNNQQTKQSLGYRFQCNWIKRYNILGSYLFEFEVGRRCPKGEGEIRVKTAGDAAKIRKTVLSNTSNCMR